MMWSLYIAHVDSLTHSWILLNAKGVMSPNVFNLHHIGSRTHPDGQSHNQTDHLLWWTDGRVDGRMNGLLVGWMDGWIDCQMGGSDRWTDGLGGWLYRWSNGFTERWLNGCMVIFYGRMNDRANGRTDG